MRPGSLRANMRRDGGRSERRARIYEDFRCNYESIRSNLRHGEADHTNAQHPEAHCHGTGDPARSVGARARHGARGP